jgi:hypothetical protein
LNDAREVLFERQVNFVLDLFYSFLFSLKILNEMIEHSTNMNVVLKKINDFYIEHKLEPDEIIG